MATSSITANFQCLNTKAATAFVNLLLAETPPAKWTAPVPRNQSHEFKSKADIISFVKRVVRSRKSTSKA
jgi:hypothetical protein